MDSDNYSRSKRDFRFLDELIASAGAGAPSAAAGDKAGTLDIRAYTQ